MAHKTKDPRHGDITTWSNAKKARMFAHLIAYLAAKYGDHGELRVPLDDLGEDFTIGMAVEDGILIVAVDMDRVDLEKLHRVV